MIAEVIDINIDYEKLGLDNGGCKARLYTYVLDNSREMNPDRVRPTVIICPGGGYVMTSDREAEAIAIKLNSFGFQAFILRYSIAPATYPTALTELAFAVATVREHAEKWHVDTNKIIVAGFSAGGHLAASLGMFWHESFLSDSLKLESETIKPNGLLLGYPVITSGEFAHRDSFKSLLGSRYNELVDTMSLEKQVNAYTPPTFMWHTYTDDCVPVQNALLLADALTRNDIPLELHIYPRGGHGLSLANEETAGGNGYGVQAECQNWIDLAATWVSNL